MKERLLYRLRDNGGKVEVKFESKSDNWIPLDGLQKQLKFLDAINTSVFKYLVSFTLLLGDLCLKRNYLAIEILQELFTFDICFNIIVSDDYPPNIREAFTFLFTALWVDVAPLQKKKIPGQIKLWGDQKNNEPMTPASRMRTNTDGRFENVKKENIHYLKSFHEDFLYNNVKTSFIVKLLKLLKKMIQMNLLSETEVKDTFQILKSLLNSLVRIS